MRPARARWAGFLLTMVWMVARLALPLQPTCPHHAPHLSASAGTATSGAVDGAATHHAHHGASSASSQEAMPDSAPASTAPECECAAHCCAAPGVQFIASASIASVVLLDAPRGASTPENRRLRPALRLDVAQPPATAPPALTL
ncbi:hypothetical protein [Gemmatimonas aurantiaca]|uniref:hypothetical protein n=1 Tax=Gemmatimonas aurantiaca TaxID=173480 RepID=UPI00301D492B